MTNFRTLTEYGVALAAVDAELVGIADEARALRATIGDAAPTTAQAAAEASQQEATSRLLDQRATLRAGRLALEQQHAAIADGVAAGTNTEGLIQPTAFTRTRSRTMPASTLAPHDLARAAFAAIEQINNPKAQDRLDRIIRAEQLPVVARYVAAVGSPVYADAWAKVMADPEAAQFTLSNEERAAMAEARSASRLLALTTGTAGDGNGGYALPLLVDPTLIFTNDGSTNPFRAIATVKTIVQKTTRVVTIDEIAAAYGAEGTDVALAQPSLDRPDLTAERATAFVKLSYEMFADWSGAQGELARGFADARDNLEAEKFAIGSGVNEPEGIVTGLTAFDGSVSTPADLYAVQADLGPRWQPGARWLMNLAEHNLLGQLVATASPTLSAIFDAQGNLLHRPVTEASYMPDGDLVYGDVRAGFVIVDRLGMAVEAVPHTFNPVTGLPDGYRGVLAIWRSGSKVVIPGALRLLADGS